jgi:cellulose synthase operon protein YhjQ
MMESEQSSTQGHTSDDVESLYSWANMQWTKYRDFSASREQTRAEFRERMVREQPAAINRPAIQAHQQAAIEESSAGNTGPSEVKQSKVAPSIPTPWLRSFADGRVSLPQPPPDDIALSLRPQWLTIQPKPAAQSAKPEDETLQQAKERMASRWFALKGIFASPREEVEAVSPAKVERRIPAVVVFSVAGGVGKTSLVAALGRALAAHGERVLLVDTTSCGLLPFYFGSRELKSGTVRTFSPPNGSTDAPVHVVSLDAERHPGDGGDGDQLLEDLLRDAHGSSRILVDVQTAAKSVAQRLVRLAPHVLVPLLPDMNSIVSLSFVEAALSEVSDPGGNSIGPFYLLNQFDPALALHVDVREILQERLGERLLPFVVRRSTTVSEALAEGMTVMDYAPNSLAAEDYVHLANLLRSISAPAPRGYRGVRWSEQ